MLSGGKIINGVINIMEALFLNYFNRIWHFFTAISCYIALYMYTQYDISVICRYMGPANLSVRLYSKPKPRYPDDVT